MLKSKLFLYLSFFVLFFLITNVFAQEKYIVEVERIIDGDTFVIDWPTLPFGMNKVSIRIRGIDTPEIHSKCEKEKTSAETSKSFLSNWILHKQVIIANCENDKFGGRWLCDVEYKNSEVSSTMIVNGFARPYNGEKKIPWCVK